MVENKENFHEIKVENIDTTPEEEEIEVMTLELFESWLEQAFTIAG